MAYFPEKVTINPVTTASDVNTFNANYLIGGGTGVTGFSSARFKYVGNLLTSILFDNGSGSAAGSFNINANLYFDGTSTFRSRTNETCVTAVLGGAVAQGTGVFSIFADSSISSAAGSAVTTALKFSVNSLGLCTLGDATTNDTLVHKVHGSISLLGTNIPSFSSTIYRYIGTKESSLLIQGGAVAAAGVLNTYANVYYNGSATLFSRLNETGCAVLINGATTTTAVSYAFAADPSISHAADAAATLVNLHTIDSLGAHAIGHASTNSTQVQQVYGSVNLKGAVVPSFSSTRFRYVGTKLTSLLFDDGSGAAAGAIYTFANLYFDGTNFRRSRANETCAQVLANGATTATANVWMLNADSSVASAADSVVAPATIMAATSQGTFSVGPSTATAIVHSINGSVNVLGTVIPSFSSTTNRYYGSKVSNILFLTGSASSSGNINIFANMYFDGTSSKYAIANETCTNVFIAGGTSATGNAFIVASDPSISHSADVASAVVNTLAIPATGGIVGYAYNDATPHILWGDTNFGATESIAFIRKVDNTTGLNVTKFLAFSRNCTTPTTTGTEVGYIGTDVTGTVGCFTSSDARLKDNIEDFVSGIDTVKNVAARSFDWKEAPKVGEKAIGFIAQELQKYSPNAIVPIDHETLGISYNVLTTLLWSTVRDLIARIEILEKNK